MQSGEDIIYYVVSARLFSPVNTAQKTPHRDWVGAFHRVNTINKEDNKEDKKKKKTRCTIGDRGLTPA